MILASQKCVFDKRGLGYKTSKNEKYFKNYFVKESVSESSSTICNFCGRGGHISFCGQKAFERMNGCYPHSQNSLVDKRLLK